MAFGVLLIAACWVLVSSFNDQCEDANTVACQVMHQDDPNMCNDSTIAETLCPKYCNKCRLVCYHCDQAASKYTDCVQMKVCNPGEKCMIARWRSINSTSLEYIMDCATTQSCQNFMLLGKRHARNTDGSKCCETNLCNLPSSNPTSTSATTHTPVHVTSHPTTTPTEAPATQPTTAPTPQSITHHATHASVSTSKPNACVSAGYSYSPDLRLCLRIYSSMLLNWTQAQDACAKDGAQLVVSTTAAKNSAVQTFLQQRHLTGVSNHFWMGSTTVVQPHVYTWSDGNHVVVFPYQDEDLTRAQCLLVGRSITLDICYRRHPFICEKNEYISY